MSVTDLQQRIRQKKTPLALGLRPEPEKLSPKILKNFTDMFGPGSMAEAEALRYHGTTLLDAAAETLPAVMLHGASYLRCGMMGADVLSNLISARPVAGLRRRRHHRGSLHGQRLLRCRRAGGVRSGAYLQQERR